MAWEFALILLTRVFRGELISPRIEFQDRHSPEKAVKAAHMTRGDRAGRHPGPAADRNPDRKGTPRCR
jgi:hypothetical protein